MDYIIKDGELYHHGVLGQKWGVRRYQNKDGSLTQAGKKRVSKKQKKALEKARKAKQAKAEAAKKAKQAQEEFEIGKKKAIESGSAKDVLKYKGKLTNEELQRAVTRINMEQRLSEISAKETKTGLDKAESFMNKVDRVNKMANKGIDSWNIMAKILNSTTDADLPLIKEEGKKKVDKAAENVKKEAGKEAKKEAKKAEKEAKKTDNETYTGEVFGEGTSRRKSNTESRGKRYAETIIIDDYADKTTSDVLNTRAALLGQNYIAGLLPAPRKDDD